MVNDLVFEWREEKGKKWDDEGDDFDDGNRAEQERIVNISILTMSLNNSNKKMRERKGDRRKKENERVKQSNQNICRSLWNGHFIRTEHALSNMRRVDEGKTCDRTTSIDLDDRLHSSNKNSIPSRPTSLPPPSSSSSSSTLSISNDLSSRRRYASDSNSNMDRTSPTALVTSFLQYLRHELRTTASEKKYGYRRQVRSNTIISIDFFYWWFYLETIGKDKIFSTISERFNR